MYIEHTQLIRLSVSIVGDTPFSLLVIIGLITVIRKRLSAIAEMDHTGYSSPSFINV